MAQRLASAAPLALFKAMKANFPRGRADGTLRSFVALETGRHIDLFKTEDTLEAFRARREKAPAPVYKGRFEPGRLSRRGDGWRRHRFIVTASPLRGVSKSPHARAGAVEMTARIFDGNVEADDAGRAGIAGRYEHDPRAINLDGGRRAGALRLEQFRPIVSRRHRDRAPARGAPRMPNGSRRRRRPMVPVAPGGSPEAVRIVPRFSVAFRVDGGEHAVHIGRMKMGEGVAARVELGDVAQAERGPQALSAIAQRVGRLEDQHVACIAAAPREIAPGRRVGGDGLHRAF